MPMYRQGDVLIVPTTLSPIAPVKPDGDGSVTVAHGEATGHRHRFAEGSAVSLSSSPSGVEAFILDITEGGGTLVHEEHAPIQIAPGRYAVRIACEYDPAVHGGARRVED